jgi:glucose-1-phosphate cytidylyltransferase
MTYGDGVADVDITRSIEFHREHGKKLTVTCVLPKSRYGIVQLDSTRISSFEEKPTEGTGWVNGGFFVLSPAALDAVMDDEQMFEREPINSLVSQGEVQAFFHNGYWQCMDTLRDKQSLEELWSSGNAPWKTW